MGVCRIFKVIATVSPLRRLTPRDGDDIPLHRRIKKPFRSPSGISTCCSSIIYARGYRNYIGVLESTRQYFRKKLLFFFDAGHICIGYILTIIRPRCISSSSKHYALDRHRENRTRI